MKELKPEERLIVALDTRNGEGGRKAAREKIIGIAKDLQGLGVVIKVNSILRAIGYDLIDELHSLGLLVMADLKLDDIKNTLEDDASYLLEAKPEILTVKCSAGAQGLAALHAMLPGTEVLGVTVLTSIGDDVCSRMYEKPVKEMVIHFAREALAAELDGLVCSPNEGSLIRAVPVFNGLSINTPGIRYPWSEDKADDQVRTASAGFAIKNGVTRVVVGRPVLNAKPNDDPSKPQSRREAAEWIIRDIREALEGQMKAV
jgi:orotidine-5'-phosphate decarboxylase